MGLSFRARTIPVAFLFLLWACAGERGATTVDVGGRKVSCVEPPVEAKRTFKIGAEVKDAIVGIAQAKLDFETKWQRIRQVSPRAADFDVIAYQLCMMHAQGLISEDAFQQLLSKTLDPTEGAGLRPKWVLSGDVFVEGRKGERIEGAVVELTLEPVRYTATGSDGVFRFVMWGKDEGQTVALRVKKDGFEPFTKERIELTRELGAVAVPLEPWLEKFPVLGRVFDPVDPERGVEEAEIAVETRPRTTARSVSRGHFRLEIPRGAEGNLLSLQVRKGGYRLFKQDFRFARKMAPLDISLDREAFTFRGFVLAADEQGKAVEGAEVTLSLDPPARDLTKSDGGFRFNVPQQYHDKFRSLRVQKEGYKVVARDFKLQEGGERLEITLEREKAFDIYQRGMAFLKEGKFPEAAEALTGAINQNPNFDAALYSRCLAREKLGLFADAVQDCKRAAELDSKRFDYQLALALALVKVERHEESLPRFKEAATLRPEYPETYLEWARTLRKLKRLEEATEQFQRVLALNPRRFDACDELANVLWDRGERTGDTELTAKAIETRRWCVAIKEGRPKP